MNTATEPSRVNLLPAAFVQERLWFLHQWLPKAAIYNIPTALKLRGPLDAGALRAALDQLVSRHETLRTRFAIEGERLVQLIYPPEPMPFRFHESPISAAKLENLLREESRRAFDLTRESPIRAALFRIDENEHILLFTTHHIAADEWSVRVMLGELKALYESASSAAPSSLPDLPLQYADYAAWQNEWLEGPACAEQLEFWERTLDGFAAPAPLPMDRSRPAAPTHEGARERMVFPPNLSEAVVALGRQFSTTPFNVLFTVFQALQARYTSARQILTGTVVAGRNQVETEGLIGFFINLLAIPSAVGDEITFEELLRQVKERTLAAYARQNVPFDRVVGRLNPERSTNRMPLTDVLFTIQETILERGQWGPLTVEWVEVYSGTAKFDLNVTIEKSGETFAMLAEYSTDLFDSATIQRLCRHYCNLLGAFARDPKQKVWTAEILDAAEKRLILENWNATDAALPCPATIDGIFTDQAKASPDAVALRFQGGQWRYRELNERAERLAALLSARGVGLETPVGVFLERGPELIQTLLAILKTGACYVPLETEYPEERLRYLMDDAGTTVLVTEQRLLAKLPATDGSIILVDDLAPEAAPSISGRPHAETNAAYVMYTSGSTGKPKGVVVTHRNVARLVKGANYMSFDAKEVFLQYAPLSFDASTLEIWGPLLNGGQLCIMPPRQVSLEELQDALTRFEVTTLWLTAGLFNLAVDEQIECFRGLRQMITGGDAGSPKHFRRFLEHHPQCRLFNGYGPTENTTFTTVAAVSLEDLPDFPHSASVPIGQPISNTQVYILDRFMQPVPIGVTGELYAGGGGVVREYLNAPDLTAQRFLPDPFRPGGRLYRTGDLARWLPNGVVQFLGRRDHQVKIRGFRVELGEIEELLRSHPAIHEAVVAVAVMAEPVPQQKILVAYWTARRDEAAPDQNEFRAFVKSHLPAHMAPSAFVRMESLPLDANGKVNRHALPAPILPAISEEKSGTTGLEEQLLELWREVFHREELGVHDDFFDLGGQSLLATQVVSRIRRALKIDLPISALFDHGTVAELALFIESRPESKAARP